MRHVFARVKSRRVLLLPAHEGVFGLHRVRRLADLRRIMVEAVIHVLHVHHVHV